MTPNATITVTETERMGPQGVGLVVLSAMELVYDHPAQALQWVTLIA